MRQIDVQEIIQKVKSMVMDAEYTLPEDFVESLKTAVSFEESPTGKEILNTILENARVSSAEKVAYCQDTGYPVFFVEVGQDVHITGGSIKEAINEGVRQATREGYL
ncbi:MAG: fumarate hydratase, partial [Sulfurovum sp.]|nr:fumarate hydratase [Sulfurovum sp.]